MELAALAQAVTMHSFGPAQPPLDRHLAAGRVGDQLGNGEGRDLVRPLDQQPLVLGFDLRQAADARTDHHAAAERVVLGEVDARVLDRVDGGHHGELREAIELLFVAGLDVARRRPIGDFAAEADAVVRGVETAQRGNPALAVADASPDFRDLAAKRSDRTQTRYDDAPLHGSFTDVKL